jgi:uncharacterized repeat protein (TIGR03837 family)
LYWHGAGSAGAAKRLVLKFPPGHLAKPMPAISTRWDIFCAVVDNYGDVGVAWRLARQLAREHGLAVRLFVNDTTTIARLAPEIDASVHAQRVQGVDVRSWVGARADLAAEPGDVVIEAFGCGVPPAYVAKMAARERQPVWVNLEYLSAESWIEGCHGLESRHPSLPLSRHFFFPGFTKQSGGLLHERDLLVRRDRFCADARERDELWRLLGIGAPARETRLVSLFCYPNAALPSLLDVWAHGDKPLLCLVPEGVAREALARWTGGVMLDAGRHFTRGQLALAGVPFVPQDDYDRLLWACDVNFVRGEDSFVRAQWAGRPMIWHAYPQAEDAHRLKLDAFLARYALALPAAPAEALRTISTAWNSADSIGGAWKGFVRAIPALSAHAQAWAQELAVQPDLGATLVKFCADRV